MENEVDVGETMRVTLRDEARRLASSYAPDAVEVIAELMLSKKTAPGVRRQCAMDLVAISGGMASTRGEADGGRSLTVNILKLSEQSEDGFAVEVEELREVVGDIVELSESGSIPG